ncbi:MAG: DUF4389 domain-containing protein [Dehalococcoidia bacterium]|nr:DUF4389 domain-containing protein [Dehalococcoidia bacterium]
MAVAYPATLDMTCRDKIPRDQSIMHILALFVLWIAGGIIGFLAYIVAPIVIAFRVGKKGGAKYVEEDGPEFSRYGGMLVAIYAYAFFLTDELPDKAVGSSVKVEFKPSGNPSWLEALLRPILLIPSGLVLGLFGIAFILILPWTVIDALVNERYPRRFFEFVLGYLRWQTRMTAYLFSLTQEYPPFPVSDLLNSLLGNGAQS